MKKIVGILSAAAVLAASVFAVDFSATVQVKGDALYGKSVDSTNSIAILGVENTNQKDNDLLEISFTGDKAGAFVRFWTTAKEEVLKVRALKVWFEPITGIKVTVGNNDLELYKERVNWWKVPCGASVAEFGSWDGRWASGAAVHENFGTTVEISAIQNLYIGLGASSDVFSKTGDADAAINQWGVVAKYQIMDNISAGAAWRYTPNFGLLTAGAEFGNWGTPYYGFLQAKVRFDGSSAANSGSKDWKLAGITIDNYISYKLDSGIKFEGTFPVTIRGLLDKDDNTDVSYMTARAKVTVPVDSVNIYAVIGSDEGLNSDRLFNSVANAIWVFDKFGDNFNFYGNVGAAFSVGTCSLDLGIEVAYDKPSKTFAWAVPFAAKVAF